MVSRAVPVQVTVFVILLALGSWEGLAGQGALPESKAIPGVLKNIMSISSVICLDTLHDQQIRHVLIYMG